MALELPFLALIDTTVFSCHLGNSSGDPDAPACADFCERMLKEHRTLLVSAMSLTEVTRRTGIAPPRMPGIVIVPFDEVAATRLGEVLPHSQLKQWHDDATGRSFGHIKYDALIIGCALRVPPPCTFVSMDRKQRELATRLNLAAHHPRDYKPAEPQVVKPQQGLLLASE